MQINKNQEILFYFFSCVKLWVEKKMLREIFFLLYLKKKISVGFKHDHQIFFMCEIWVGRNFGGKKLDDLICPVSFTPREKKKSQKFWREKKSGD